jgi:ABC-2 type transport system permease protein
VTDGPTGGGVGQVVATGSASGNIYDLGYRGYEGPRLGRRHAVASLIRQSFRQAWGIGRGGRAKIAPITFAGIATVPAVVLLGALALTAQLGADEVVESASPIRYSSYYPLISVAVFLFAAAQAPELLGRDLRHRVLALYFSRAIERIDYALAKLAAMGLAMLLLVLFPQVLLLLGRALMAPDLVAGIQRDLPTVPAILGQAVVTAGLLGSLALAIASFTPRRSFATAAIFASVLVPLIVVAVAEELTTPDIATALSLLSPADLLDGANDFFYGVTRAGPSDDLPSVAYAVAAVVVAIGATAVLVWRYRRIEP